MILLYDNIADAASIEAGYTDPLYPTSNLKKDNKSLVWRSTRLTDTLTVFNLVGNIDTVILAFTNMTSGTLDSTTIVGAVDAVFQLDITSPGTNDSNLLTGVYKYSLGNTIYAVCYFSPVVTPILQITISSNQPVEVSRLIIGESWHHKFHMATGFEVGVVDSSQTSRTFAGNSVTDQGTRHKTLNFSLPYMLIEEMVIFQELQRLNKAMFISLFPEDADGDKEQAYQIYGKLSSLASIAHPMHTQFTSSISLEEV